MYGWLEAWGDSLPPWPWLRALGVVWLCALSFLLTRYVVAPGLRKLARRSSAVWDDVLFHPGVLNKVALLAPVLVVQSSAYMFTKVGPLLHRFSTVALVIVVALMVLDLLSALNEVWNLVGPGRTRPIKGYVQTIKLFVILATAVLVLAVLFDRSPLAFLSGIGALTAVLLLIFRDTLLSFVAGVQIANADLLRIGDWIEVPSFNADGEVVDVALHTVTIRNWDNTFTAIPPYKLLEVAFKNWRGMKEAGARRLKRSILIDQHSIRFCDERMLEKFAKIRLITDYIRTKSEELRESNQAEGADPTVLVNGRRMTNVGTFRVYALAYIKSHTRIREDMDVIVRQLQPLPEGLPLEVYAYVKDTAFGEFEVVQADIFDHLLAVVPEFELRVLQSVRVAG